MLSSKKQTIREDELPVDEPFGELEAVAYFYDAMPTGVTVSHKGTHLCQLSKMGRRREID